MSGRLRQAPRALLAVLVAFGRILDGRNLVESFQCPICARVLALVSLPSVQATPRPCPWCPIPSGSDSGRVRTVASSRYGREIDASFEPLIYSQGISGMLEGRGPSHQKCGRGIPMHSRTFHLPSPVSPEPIQSCRPYASMRVWIMATRFCSSLSVTGGERRCAHAVHQPLKAVQVHQYSISGQ